MSLKSKIKRLRANDPKLTELDLSNWELTPVEAWVLGEALASNTVLQSLCLENMTLSRKEWLDVMDGLKHNTALTSLNLNNTILLRDAKMNNEVCDFLRTMTQLQDLRLDCDGDRWFHNYVSDIPVTHFGLFSTLIHEKLVTKLMSVRTLRMISFEDCSFDSCGGKTLCDLILRLEEINIYGESFDIGLRPECIVEQLRSSTTLTTFALVLTDKTVNCNPILDALVENTTLTSLKLYVYGLETDSICRLIRRNTTLTHLGIRVKKSRPENKMIVRALTANGSVVKFDGCRGDKFMRHVEDILERNIHNYDMKNQGLIAWMLSLV